MFLELLPTFLSLQFCRLFGLFFLGPLGADLLYLLGSKFNFCLFNGYIIYVDIMTGRKLVVNLGC